MLLLLYSLTDCDDAKTFIVLIILFVASAVCMVSYAVSLNQEKPREYPASEYDFKIKVVEFEEQRDTILVVTPKDKSK